MTEIQMGGSHYQKHKIQPIELILDHGMSFPEGCIVKYVCRHKEKGGAEDIKKLIHNAAFILESYYGIETNVSYSAIGV